MVQAPISITWGRLEAARRRNTPVFTVFDNISTDINCTEACWYFGNSAVECVNKSADFASVNARAREHSHFFPNQKSAQISKHIYQRQLFEDEKCTGLMNERGQPKWETRDSVCLSFLQISRSKFKNFRMN
jgi:hypothetical protein